MILISGRAYQETSKLEYFGPFEFSLFQTLVPLLVFQGD